MLRRPLETHRQGDIVGHWALVCSTPKTGHAALYRRCQQAKATPTELHSSALLPIIAGAVRMSVAAMRLDRHYDDMAVTHAAFSDDVIGERFHRRGHRRRGLVEG